MNAGSPVSVWLLRGLWVLQPLAFVPLVSDSTSALPGAGRFIAAVIAWVAWAAVLLATLVPSTVSLTAGRLAAPLPLAVVVVCALGPGAAGWEVAIAAAAGLVAVLVWFSGEIGGVLAQGSAYGAEQRFPLKPPVPYLAPMVVSWLLLAATSMGAATSLANELWIVGIGLAAITAAVAVFVAPRFHQLARRWLVVVPVGVVVHDPMLLAENALFRTGALLALHLAPADTEAADLSGGAAGTAVEIVLREMDTVVKIGSRVQPTGVALHVRSVLVSPTRPGRALAAAAARNMPVG